MAEGPQYYCCNKGSMKLSGRNKLQLITGNRSHQTYSFTL